MKSGSRLSLDQIEEILLLYRDKFKKAEIAGRVGCDDATVGYYAKKFKYILLLPADEFHQALRQSHKAKCQHTSFKCSVCGLYVDNTQRDDYFTIQHLNRRVFYLERLLSSNRIAFEKDGGIMKRVDN